MNLFIRVKIVIIITISILVILLSINMIISDPLYCMDHYIDKLTTLEMERAKAVRSLNRCNEIYDKLYEGKVLNAEQEENRLDLLESIYTAQDNIQKIDSDIASHEADRTLSSTKKKSKKTSVFKCFTFNIVVNFIHYFTLQICMVY